MPNETMPNETKQAVTWALAQDEVVVDGVVDRHALVDNVRQYFNDHNIPYGTFSAVDLDPYLP